MHIKLDENIPLALRAVFRDAGHDVHTARDEGLAGATDQDLAARCLAEGRVLVTLDLDFADLRFFPPGDSSGLIVLRPVSQDIHRLVSIARRLATLLESQPVAGLLWIVDDEHVRIRGE